MKPRERVLPRHGIRADGRGRRHGRSAEAAWAVPEAAWAVPEDRAEASASQALEYWAKVRLAAAPLYAPLTRRSGTCTATTSPRTQISPRAMIVAVTTTLRPLISLTRARSSRGTPIGVGSR